MLKGNGIFYKMALIIEAVILLALLIGCFGREELAASFTGADMGSGLVQAEDHEDFYSPPMELTPGVYQVRVKSSLGEGAKVYVVMESEEAPFNTLRNNGMWAPEGYEDFEVYVTGRVPGAYVKFSFYGGAPGDKLQLEVWKTKAGNRIGLFLGFVCFGVVDFLALFRRRILEGRVTGRQQVVFWCLAGVVLVSFFPYLTDYVILGTDTYFYLDRIAGLADGIRMGTLLSGGGVGAGLYEYGVSPSFGDLILVVPVLLQLVGFSVMSAYRMYFFLLIVAAAAIAYDSFYRCVKEECAALAGSVVYLLVPYRIYGMYDRGALGECLVMVFLPLVFACLVFWKEGWQKHTLVQLLEAMGGLLAVGLLFWSSMLLRQEADSYLLSRNATENSQGGVMLAGLFQMLPEKGGGQIGMWHCEPVQLGAGAVMLLLLYGLWFFYRRKRGGTGNLRDGCGLFAVFTVVMMVMSTWCFPSIWMALGSVTAAMFTVLFVRQVEEAGGRLVQVAVTVAVLVAVVSAVYQVNSIALHSGATWVYNAENMRIVE